jgi:hypothetical protein
MIITPNSSTIQGSPPRPNNGPVIDISGENTIGASRGNLSRIGCFFFFGRLTIFGRLDSQDEENG